MLQAQQSDPWQGWPDAGPQATASAQHGQQGDPWSGWSDGGPSTQRPSSGGSLIKQFPTGFNEGLADVVGAPVDFVTWLANKFPGVQIKKPVLGSDSIKSGMGLIGADPRDTPANTTAEKIVRGAGSGTAAMIAPEAAVTTLGRVGALTPEAVNAAGRFIGDSAGVGDVAASSTIGAVGGAGGEAAAEVTPPKYQPLARTVATLAGGGLGAAAMAGARAIPEAVRGVREFAAPMTQAGRDAIAGRELETRAEDPTAVRDALSNQPPELVPGSKPTTFQLTGDMGLGALERDQQTKNPADFMQRRADQNAARVDALQNIQPTGAPVEVANAVRGSLRDIDATTHGAVEQASSEAQNAAQALGGQGMPQDYGAALRGTLQDAENTARTRERGLWQAVDPDGTLTVNMATVKQAAQTVYGDMTAAGRAGLSPTETTIQRVMDTYRPAEPFRELADLRSAISSGMRNELATAGRTPAYARLSQLRGTVEDSISGAVQQQTTEEAQAVARGQISPEDTAAARIGEWINDFRARQSSAVVGSDIGGNSTGRAPGIAGIPRATREESSGLSGAPSNQGMPNVAPTFDAAARERLTAANTATRDRVATYNKGAVGQVLRSQGERGQYRLPDSAAAAAIFKPGPGGYESVSAFRRATDDPTALATLQDYIASRLRQVASRPDGALDPTKTANWLRAHSEALRAFPDLASRFSDAATATSAIEDVAAVQREALENMQRGTLGRLIGATDDAAVTKIVGSVFSQSNPAQAMRQLVGEARRDPTAVEGLRKAVVDYMYGRFISNTEAATSGTNSLRSDSFQTFVRQNRSVLRQVLAEGEVNALSAIAADLNRASRSLNAVRIPGQSNTAQDITSELARKTEGHGSVLSQIVLAGGGGYAAHGASGALAGVMGVLGKNVISRMRDAGMEKVGDLVKQAMLDPNLARYLLAKAPAKPGSGVSVSLAQQLRRLSMFDTLMSRQSMPDRHQDRPAAPQT